MLMAARLSQRLGLIEQAFVDRLQALVQRAGLPVSGPALGANEYLEHMRLDKKSEGGQIKFVLIDQPGRVSVKEAPDGMVAEVIEASCKA